jgi:signal transduction histidine kinase/DNA-binding NarL/FixJ family response regulator
VGTFLKLAAFAREARSRRRALAQLHDLVESLPGAVFQCRAWPDGRLRYEMLSKSTRHVRGVDPEAALLDSNVILDTVLETDRKVFRDSLAWGAKAMKPVEIDYRVMHPEKGVRWIRSVSSPAPGEGGTVLWSGHWADITTQKELEAGLLRAMEEADAASEAKSRFLATMSHEIRTPMNGVLAMLELLSLGKLDAEQAASLAIVRESGQALLRIIDDILDFSKIEAGKMDIVPEASSLARLLERIVNMHSGIASRKGLLLSTTMDAEIAPALMFDPVRVQQIINNLVSNAIKFTAQGEVSIAVRLAEDRGAEQVVRLEVKDTGIGMTPKQQERIFEAFSQASAETAGRYGGTGLGLSISRRLAKLMGGAIEMRTRAGIGTEVRVTLPMKVADAADIARAEPLAVPPLPRRREPPPIDEAERNRRLALLVDDHPINRMILLKQVNALGYAAETADSGSEGLAMWSTGRFAAIFTDCNMPELSGYDLARAIRAEELRTRAARTPIIACTANALAGEAEKCIEVGMDDYIVKPVELAQLSLKLERWMHGVPVERATLAAISGGDDRLEIEVLARFRLHNTQDAESLREAFGRKASGDVMAACHRIKGASKTLGAMALSECCERIEVACRAGDWTAAASGMRAFERELARLDAFIDARSAA